MIKQPVVITVEVPAQEAPFIRSALLEIDEENGLLRSKRFAFISADERAATYGATVRFSFVNPTNPFSPSGGLAKV